MKTRRLVVEAALGAAICVVMVYDGMPSWSVALAALLFVLVLSGEVGDAP